MRIYKVLKNPFTKIVAVSAIGVFALVFVSSSKIQAFSGSGTGLNQGEEYIITTCSQLQEMADDLNAWYKLGNNIDCSGSASWNSNAGFMPIGDPGDSFHGVFEGAGYTISGLTINRPTTDYVGLFGYIGGAGSAQRFRFTEASITGRDYVGAIAGQTLNGDVYNIGAYGEVTGRDYVGGVVGDNGGGVMIMHSHVNISGVSGAGVGGGLVGENHGFVIRSYSTGSVPSGPGKGGLVGHDAGSGGNSGSFWDTQTSGNSGSDGGTGKSTAELKNVVTFTDTETAGLSTAWDFVHNPNDDIDTNDPWNINPLINQGYPYLVGQTPGLPDTFLTSLPQNPTNNNELAFEFESTVPGSTFECKIEPDDTDYEPCTSPYVLPPNADGTYSFLVKAINSDGVADQTPAERETIIDTIEPNTFITQLGSAPINTATTNFILTSNETATFECDLDGAGYEDCDPTYMTPSLVDGGHTLLVRATDAAGNTDATSVNYSWVVDTLAPTTSLSMTDPPIGKATATIEFSGNEAPVTFECNLDDAGYEACTSPYVTPALMNGDHTLLVRATDEAGNVEDPPASDSWTVAFDADSDDTPDEVEGTVSTKSVSSNNKNNSGVRTDAVANSSVNDIGEEDGITADTSGETVASNESSTSNSDSDKNSDKDSPATTVVSTKWTNMMLAGIICAGLIITYFAFWSRRKQK